MRILLSGIGCLVSMMFLVASAAMNWQFGVSLGRGEIERQIYGAASVGADVMKALLPFFIWWSLTNMRIAVSLVALILWMVCAVYGLASAVGFAAANREGTAGELKGKGIAYAGLKAELARKELRRAELGTLESPAEIDKRLEGLRMAWQWRGSKECTEIKSKDATSFCEIFRQVEGLRARGEEARQLDASLPGLRAQVASGGAADAYTNGVPQTSLVSVVLGIPEALVERGLSLLMVAVVELSSAFGFFVSLQHGGFGRRHARDSTNDENAAPGDVAIFADQCLVPSDGAATPLGALFVSYERWCRKMRTPSLRNDEFKEGILLLAAEIGWRVDDGRLLDWGIKRNG